MALLSRAMILEALEAVARELEAMGTTRQEIALAGGAALVLKYNAREATRDVDFCSVGSARVATVDIGDARLLLTEISGRREEVWSGLEPFLVPGRETKARYAFEDLWESVHGP